jgi:hypothetical protein
MPLCWHIFFVIFEFPALIHGVYTEWVTRSLKYITIKFILAFSVYTKLGELSLILIQLLKVS